MPDTVDEPVEAPIRLDPAERWDFLLTIADPTDDECWRALTTEAGVTALQKYPNIVEKATKVYQHLPAVLLMNYPPEWKASAVRDKVALDAIAEAKNTGGLFN